MILDEKEIEDVISGFTKSDEHNADNDYWLIREAEIVVANKILSELIKAFNWSLPNNASEETKLEYEVDQHNVEFIKQVMWEYGLEIHRKQSYFERQIPQVQFVCKFLIQGTAQVYSALNRFKLSKGEGHE